MNKTIYAGEELIIYFPQAVYAGEIRKDMRRIFPLGTIKRPLQFDFVHQGRRYFRYNFRDCHLVWVLDPAADIDKIEMNRYANRLIEHVIDINQEKITLKREPLKCQNSI